MRLGLRAPSLRTQLVAGFVLVTVLATVLVSLTAVWLRRQALVDDVTTQALDALQADLLTAGRRVNDRAAPRGMVGEAAYRLLRDADLEQLGTELTPVDGGDAIVLVQPGDTANDYRSRPDVGPDAVPADLRAIVAQGLLGEVRQERQGRMELVVGGRVASDALAVYRFVDLSRIDRELGVMGRTLARAGVVPIASALLVGLFAAGRLLRPVRRARDAAGKLGEGQLDTRLPVRGGDELADLSRSFNEMAASLQATVEELRTMEAQQRRFVADVSHELRTPLTALVVAVEVLEEELAAASDEGATGIREDRRQATLLAIEEVRGMRELVEDLMEITRFDAGRALLDTVPTNLAAAVASTLRRRNLDDRVAADVPGDLVAHVDPRRLDTIVANLVGNALTHGARPVAVRAAAVGADVVLEVVDAGPGVPAAVRAQLFERFVKGDRARTRAGGSGLGLAIARENARLHGGDIELVDTGPAGTTMRCTLPGRVATTDAATAGAPTGSPDPARVRT